MPATGVQVCTRVGPLTIVGAGQVVVVQKFPGAPADGVQVETARLVVLTGLQVVVVQLLTISATAGAQADTPVGPVVIGAGQVVSVQLLPRFGPEGVHEET